MSKLNQPHRAGRVRTSRTTSLRTWRRGDFGTRSSILAAFAWLSSGAGCGDAHD